MNNANKKYASQEGYRRRGNRQAPESVDLSVLFDGDTLPEEEPAAPVAPAEPEPEPETKALEIIHPHQYHLAGELDYKPGEDGWGYLNRITPLLLKELVAMATAPISVVNAKVKLDALKELIQRPMPARTVYDIRTPAAGSEFDRMSDAQVMDFITEKIGDMRKEEVAETTASSTPEDTTPKT